MFLKDSYGTQGCASSRTKEDLVHAHDNILMWWPVTLRNICWHRIARFLSEIDNERIVLSIVAITG